MRKFIVAAATVAALAAAAPAYAAGQTGPYVGAGVTYDSINGTGSAEGFGISGVGGTVYAGYNLGFEGNTFVGLEANFDLASADLGDKVNGVKADHQFGASARLGYRLTPGAAFYAKAGYQRGRASAYSAGVKTSASRDGLLLGAGLEADLTANVAVRVEFNRTQFYRDNAVDPAGAGLANNKAVVGLQFGF